MENPSTDSPPSQVPHTSISRRSTSTVDPANSPEFEFWKVLNPSLPQPSLLSADELFVDGVLLPLHLLHLHPNHDLTDNNTQQLPTTHNPEKPKHMSNPGPGPDPLSSTLLLPDPALGVSKRWIDMFKKSDKKDESCNKLEKQEKKKKERKANNGGVSGAGTELNIYLWPFRRSRSAGNGGSRPRTAAAAVRKVSSAPCSRSNSAGESKTTARMRSPGRAGVHLGRSSPVWKVRRGGGAGAGRGFDPVVPVVRSQRDGSETGRKMKSAGGESKARALNLNVPMCIGYRQHLSCKSEGGGAVNVAAVGGGGGGSGHGGDGGGRGGNFLNLRSLFSKKVY